MSLGREGVAYTLGGSAFGDAVKPVEGERRRTRCNRRAAVVTRQPRSNSFIPWCLLKLRINRASFALANGNLCTATVSTVCSNCEQQLRHRCVPQQCCCSRARAQWITCRATPGLQPEQKP